MKALKVFFLGVSFYLILFLGFAQAQQVEALSRSSSDTMRIGDQLLYELFITFPQGFAIEWPVWTDTIPGGMEILSSSAPETMPADKKGNMIMRQQLLLTTFDTGYINIPGINIRFTSANIADTFVAQSNPLLIRVFDVEVDTASAFKPIKGIEKMPVTLAEVLPWVIGIFGLAALLFALVWLYMRHRNKPVSLQPILKPTVPPHQLALEQLEELRHEKLWQNGKVKAYYTRLSDIVRVYIETQFPVNAVEMTTYEIMQAVRFLGINPEALNKLSATLELADLVKFAKAQPTALENDLCLQHLIDFVKESYIVLPKNETEEPTKEEVQ